MHMSCNPSYYSVKYTIIAGFFTGMGVWVSDRTDTIKSYETSWQHRGSRHHVRLPWCVSCLDTKFACQSPCSVSATLMSARRMSELCVTRLLTLHHVNTASLVSPWCHTACSLSHPWDDMLHRHRVSHSVPDQDVQTLDVMTQDVMP
jgi:hypothetical protein